MFYNGDAFIIGITRKDLKNNFGQKLCKYEPEGRSSLTLVKLKLCTKIGCHFLESAPQITPLSINKIIYASKGGDDEYRKVRRPWLPWSISFLCLYLTSLSNHSRGSYESEWVDHYPETLWLGLEQLL